MNHFTHNSTMVLESQLNFSKLEDDKITFSGKCSVSAQMGLPKDVEKTPAVICALNFWLGSEEDNVQIHVKTRSVFDIEGTAEIETLSEDAKKLCYPEAYRILAEKISELTKLHVGVPLQLDLSYQE